MKRRGHFESKVIQILNKQITVLIRVKNEFKHAIQSN